MSDEPVPEVPSGLPTPARPEPPPAAAGGAPVPVRSLMAASTPAPETPAPEPPRERVIEVEGRALAVRVLGKAFAGPAAAPVPLLVLGYFLDGDGASPWREVLVPGRALDDLTSDDLIDGLARARPPVPPDSRAPFFPEIVAKGDKRDG